MYRAIYISKCFILIRVDEDEISAIYIILWCIDNINFFQNRIFIWSNLFFRLLFFIPQGPMLRYWYRALDGLYAGKKYTAFKMMLTDQVRCSARVMQCSVNLLTSGQYSKPLLSRQSCLLPAFLLYRINYNLSCLPQPSGRGFHCT